MVQRTEELQRRFSVESIALQEGLRASATKSRKDLSTTFWQNDDPRLLKPGSACFMQLVSDQAAEHVCPGIACVIPQKWKPNRIWRKSIDPQAGMKERKHTRGLFTCTTCKEQRGSNREEEQSEYQCERNAV